MPRCVPTLRARQAGLALVAVLWTVAALTIVVSSISYAVRQELRAVSSTRDAVVGDAMGQAAVHLVLQDLASRIDKPQRLMSIETTYRDVVMPVRVQPLNGLIDLNNAPEGLLVLLFRHAGGLERPQAEALAAATLRFRSVKDSRGREVGFEAPEDLLQVPGVDYPLYARLASLVTADLRGSGRVNALAATAEVLGVLANGDVARATAIAADRDNGRHGIDTTALTSAYVETIANTQRFRLEARVPLASGSWLLVARTVDFAAASNGVPWRILHTEHRFEPATH